MRLVKCGRWALPQLILVVFLASLASAQDPGATVRGRVLDPQGAGVTARVRVVQVRTGLEPAWQSVTVSVAPSGPDAVALGAAGLILARVFG